VCETGHGPSSGELVGGIWTGNAGLLRRLQLEIAVSIDGLGHNEKQGHRYYYYANATLPTVCNRAP
jgi:hypothetical protein